MNEEGAQLDLGAQSRPQLEATVATSQRPDQSRLVSNLLVLVENGDSQDRVSGLGDDTMRCLFEHRIEAVASNRSRGE